MEPNKNVLPPASGKMSHPNYRPDIDGLRAIAVLSVVTFHAFPTFLKGGFVGVDIFFVISGYLISSIIIKSAKNSTFSFIDFYLRRIKRIFPALITVLVFSFFIGWLLLFQDELSSLGKHIRAGASFISNFVLWNESGYFDSESHAKPLLHLWSLGIEEQFYIFWPLILWFFWRTKIKMSVGISVFFLISLGLNFNNFQINPVANFYSPQTRFWELLAGALLANYQINNLDRNSDNSGKDDLIFKNFVAITGLLLLVSSLILISEENSFPGYWALLPVLGAVFLIFSGPNTFVSKKILSHKFLVWIGLISYPLYLWHWPLFSFAWIVNGGELSRNILFVLIVISILCAWLTYKLVERPIRFKTRSRFTGAILVLAMILIGSVGQAAFQNGGFENRSVVQKNVVTASNVSFEMNPGAPCGIPGVSQYLACFVYPAANSKGTIILWGDSTAGVWKSVFLDIAKETGLTVLLIEHKSCPPILGIRKTKFDLPESRYYCDFDTKERILSFIEEVKPKEIFLLSNWNSYSPYSNREFITAQATGEANSETTQNAISTQVPLTLEALSKIGRVIVFKSWPTLPKSPKYAIDRLQFLDLTNGHVKVSKSEFEKDSAFINSILAKSDAQVEYFDPSAYTCEGKWCESVMQQTELYLDEYHISIPGSMLFRDEIKNLIWPDNQ